MFMLTIARWPLARSAAAVIRQELRSIIVNSEYMTNATATRLIASIRRRSSLDELCAIASQEFPSTARASLAVELPARRGAETSHP